MIFNQEVKNRLRKDLSVICNYTGTMYKPDVCDQSVFYFL
jgi:hypothetical protein